MYYLHEKMFNLAQTFAQLFAKSVVVQNTIAKLSINTTA